MARVERIPFPVKGLSEDASFTDQPSGTTPEARNVRGLDPVTNRARGAKRAGYSKVTTDDVGSAGERVRRLETLTLQDQLLSYAQKASGSFDLEGSATTPSGGACRNIRLDRQGNVYALDGRSGVIKYTSEFEEVYRLTVPVEDDQHALRELVVDDGGQFYVAVGNGGALAVAGRGRAHEAAIWCYRERLDEDEEDTPACRNATRAKADVRWKIETDAFVKGMVLREGRLYTVQDIPSENRAELRVYSGLDTTAPVLDQSRPVPYPATSVSVGEDGGIFMTAQAHERRGLVPKAPGYTAKSRDWTPEDLVEPGDSSSATVSKRIWSWYRAKDLEAEDGDQVNFWPDASGNGRHLFNADSTPRGPVYRSSGIGGAPSLEFVGDTNSNGTDSGSTYLTTLENVTDTAHGKDYQSTFIPGYTDGAFALFIVLRAKPSSSSSTRMAVFGGDRTDGASPTPFVLLLRATGENGAAAIGSGGYTSGGISIYEDSITPGSGSFDNDVDTAVITIIHDGGDGDFSSFLRVNGEHVGTWNSANMEFLNRAIPLGTYFGTGNTTGVEGFTGEIAELLVLNKQGIGGAHDVLEIPAAGGSGEYVSAAFSATELEAIEGYLAHEHGIAHLLPSPERDTANQVPSHPFYLSQGAPRRESIGPPGTSTAIFTSPESLLNGTDGILAKFDPTNLDAAWVLTSYAKWGGSFVVGAPNKAAYLGERYGGVGFACAVTCDGNVYAIGPESDFAFTPGSLQDFTAGFTTDQQADQVRKVIDTEDGSGNPTGSVLVANGAWSDDIPVGGSGDEWEQEAVHIEVDDFDNLLIPYYDTDASTHRSLLVLDKDGSAGAANVVTVLDLADSNNAYAVRVDPNKPDYGSASVAVHEFVYLATDIQSGSPNIHRLRLVDVTPGAGDVREVRQLAVSKGASQADIVRWSRSGVVAVTGGAGALRDDAKFIDSTVLYGDVFFTDGVSYQVYKARDNEVTAYKPTRGRVPDRYKLLTNWRGRLVFARGSRDPSSWFMSRVAKPYDCDQFPAVLTEDQAIEAANNRAGRVPDVVNAVVPYSDDWLLFMCDHTIWALRGDPMQGGQLDLVSDIAGGAFGRSWAKDPAGVLYWFGAKGGVYAMPPGGTVPRRISLRRIERQLQDIDLSTYYVELAWNYRREGLHVLVFPYAQEAAAATSYFWEAKTDAWWPDTWTGAQPTAVTVLDGDEPGDRRLVMGFSDSKLREEDEDANDDDGTGIDSLVTIGPITWDTLTQVFVGGLTGVLERDQGTCLVELLVSEEPSGPRVSVWQGELLPGRSPRLPARARGSYVWVRLRDATVGNRWALESLAAELDPAGLVQA